MTLTLALVGCSGAGGGSASIPAGQPSATASASVTPTGNTSFVETAGWPFPPDIPPFPGTLSSAMLRASGARLFFDQAGRDAYDAYLGRLRESGYQLQGRVLYSDDTAEGRARADQRAAAGDYDEMVATKAPRVLHITPGAGVVMDVDGLTSGELSALAGLDSRGGPPSATKAASTSTAPVGWPADWVDRLPAPDNCAPQEGAVNIGPTHLSALCKTSAGAGAQEALAYQAKLTQAGFAPFTASGPPGTLGMNRGPLRVTIMVAGEVGLMISVAVEQ